MAKREAAIRWLFSHRASPASPFLLWVLAHLRYNFLKNSAHTSGSGVERQVPPSAEPAQETAHIPRFRLPTWKKPAGRWSEETTMDDSPLTHPLILALGIFIRPLIADTRAPETDPCYGDATRHGSCGPISRPRSKASPNRTIIEAHGGRLWATANDGYRTILQFTQPTESVSVS
jgi:hypothetical protein